MVLYALNEVPGKFGVEKCHRQFHQFRQKIRDQGYINACTQMQQDPAADKINHASGDQQNKLCNENEQNEASDLTVNAYVHNGLRQEGENQLDKAGYDKSQHQLEYVFTIRFQVGKKVTES